MATAVDLGPTMPCTRTGITLRSIPASDGSVRPEEIMTKKKLDSYKGKLSVDQITAGINAAIQNAKRLAEWKMKGT